MVDIENVKENLEKVKENLENFIDKDIEYGLRMRKIKEEVLKKYNEYHDMIKLMCGDAPISILCLSSSTEKILLSSGCLRVYDLFNLDFVKIKGLGEVRIRNLTSRLDEFLSML